MLCEREYITTGANGSKEPAYKHKQTNINPMIKHYRKLFLPLNEHGSEKEVSSVVVNVGNSKKAGVDADADKDVDICKQQPATRKGANRKKVFPKKSKNP